MKHTHRMIIIAASLIAIVAGAGFMLEQMYLDGTVINPVVSHDMQTADMALVPMTGTFAPDGSTVAGSYQITTEKTSYAPGDYIFAHFTLCLHRMITPLVQWTFVNDIAQALAPRTGNIVATGCYTNVRIQIAQVPDEFREAFANSEYRLYGTVTYKVNPFRKITYTYVTNEFKISKVVQ